MRNSQRRHRQAEGRSVHLTSHLVQVKMKFENNKDVYDQFLDIMKDFQSRL